MESVPEQFKKCPRCRKILPLSEFGFSNTRADGRNGYDKQCNREKTNESRQAARERRRLAEEPPAPSSQPVAHFPRTPVERLLAELRRGDRGYKELQRALRMTEFEFDDALAVAVLDQRAVKPYVNGETRFYRLNERAA
jgi:hypothetical protein